MIYVLKKGNLVRLSEKPRQENEEGVYTEELIYTFEDLSLTHEVKIKLRPWHCFWIEEENIYRLEILQHLHHILDSKTGCYSYVEMSESEKEKYLKTYYNAFQVLGYKQKQVLDKKGIRFFCDILNILNEEFGKDELKLVKDYIKLSDSEQKFIINLGNFSSKNKKLEYCRNYNGDLENLIPFLPNFIIEDFIIFGASLKTNPQKPYRSFLDNSPMENITLQEELKNKIYSEFSLGVYLSGQEIKSKLQDIYNSLDIKQTPKIQDLTQFFNITRSNANNMSSYRFDTRKII